MDRTNKHTPNITYRVEERPGMFDPVHIMRLKLYVAKFKDGKYRPNVDLYIAWTGPDHPKKLVKHYKETGTEALLRRASQDIKKGCYHDWFYA